jgi:DNA-binding transcriptional LysR family regulator
MPLTTVSRKLAALEDELGARLVTRTTRHLTLTEPGRNYLEACRRIIEELEAAEARLAGEQSEPQGELAITHLSSSAACTSYPSFANSWVGFPASTHACCCSTDPWT